MVPATTGLLSHTLFFPFPFLHSVRRPIPGPADEAVRVSCQVSLFIIRKHPYKGTCPIVSAQVEEQQTRVENRKLPGFLTSSLRHLPLAPIFSWKGAETQHELFPLGSAVRKSTIFYLPELKRDLLRAKENFLKRQSAFGWGPDQWCEQKVQLNGHHQRALPISHTDHAALASAH